MSSESLVYHHTLKQHSGEKMSPCVARKVDAQENLPEGYCGRYGAVTVPVGLAFSQRYPDALVEAEGEIAHLERDNGPSHA